jgi:hypothetical protein
MTTKLPDTPHSGPADTPLALKLTEGLGLAVRRALLSDECQRLAEWALIGPVQRAALETFAERLLAEVLKERERWAADARLAAYVRERAEPSSDGWRIDVWINGAPSLETIDDVLRA